MISNKAYYSEWNRQSLASDEIPQEYIDKIERGQSITLDHKYKSDMDDFSVTNDTDRRYFILLLYVLKGNLYDKTTGRKLSKKQQIKRRDIHGLLARLWYDLR